MRWPIRIALLSGALAWGAAVGLATLAVAAQGGFGVADVRPFAVWSAFFAAFVASLAGSVARRLGGRSRVVAAGGAALAGALAGLAFSIVVALALGPVVAAFSFPVLYIWAGAGALAIAGAGFASPPPLPRPGAARPRRLRRTLGMSALVLLAVAAFPFVTFFGSVFLWDRAEHEIHLIPAGYEGPVVIIFGDSAGAPARREGRARVYAIPPNGVLRTRFAPNHGWSAPDYYYVDAAGRRSPIVRAVRCADSLPGDPARACSMPTTFVSDRSTPPAYTSYVVSRLASRSAIEARWDSVVRAEVFGDSAYRAP